MVFKTSSSATAALETTIAEANALGALDYLVEAADQETLTILAFVDIPTYARGRLVFSAPAYVQLPWRFSFRRLSACSLSSLSDSAPQIPKWALPSGAPRPDTLPSLSFDEIRDLNADGHVLFAFVDEQTQTSEPDAFIVARGLSIQRTQAV
ncbi:MAG: hypothetical protein HOW73_49815 [Polyangiaceae bacterium]|nr:hypothetical protein [Polyangiaceae bacterium]